MTWLPKDYEVPKSGQFMKLQDGENKLRVLSTPIIGWEGWKNNSPFRHEGIECKITAEQVDIDKYRKPKINHFWAFSVFNYADNRVEVLQITQKTIMSKIETYLNDDDFGDPTGYDLVIKKTKNGDKTEYDVLAKPPKPVSTEVENAYLKNTPDLQKLFEGKYPLSNGEKELMGEEDIDINDIV